jgi:hypothetical protein
VFFACLKGAWNCDTRCWHPDRHERQPEHDLKLGAASDQSREYDLQGVLFCRWRVRSFTGGLTWHHFGWPVVSALGLVYTCAAVLVPWPRGCQPTAKGTPEVVERIRLRADRERDVGGYEATGLILEEKAIPPAQHNDWRRDPARHAGSAGAERRRSGARVLLRQGEPNVPLTVLIDLHNGIPTYKEEFFDLECAGASYSDRQRHAILAWR